MKNNNCISLYIHIPFCKRKCYYCDFTSFSGKENLMIKYCNALSKEINNVHQKISTIYIGGGTPTYLSCEALKILKSAISKLDVDLNNVEFTVEGNPGTFTREKLLILKNMGVNRLSIGLQAWQDELLRTLGRIHNNKEFINSYNMARNLGFDNINVDLMYALPNQTMEQWMETLNEVVKLSPEHISCYSLILEKGTPFYTKYKKGEIIIPNEDIQILMYEKAIEYLKSNGYVQYEFSNFSKTGKECRHNLTYWNLENYVGCGASAHSYFNKVRYRNEENIEKYIYKINNEDSAVVEEHINTAKDDMEEYMFMGLRKIKGILKQDFKDKFGIDIHKVYGETIVKYKDCNLLEEDDERLFLSERGIEVSNYILSDFLL